MEYKNPTIGPGFTRSFHQIRETYDQSTASVRHQHYSHITQILLLPTMKQMMHSMDDIRKSENKNVALFHRVGRWTAADPLWLNRNEAHAFQRRHRNCIRRDATIEI